MKLRSAHSMLLPFISSVTMISGAAFAQTAAPAANPELSRTIAELQSGWEQTQYKTADKDAQSTAFEGLDTNRYIFLIFIPCLLEIVPERYNIILVDILL